MIRFVIAIILVVSSGMLNNANAVDLFLNGLPPAYSPGSTIEFSTRLIGAQNLASYQIDLVMQGTNVVNLFTFSVPNPATDPQYVFANASDGFLANVSSVSGNNNVVRLTLADSTTVPVTTATGTDLIAKVRLTIAPSFTGPFSIFIDNSAGSLILDTINGTSIPNFNQVVVNPSPTSPAIVTIPEPSSMILALLGFACWIMKGIRNRMQFTRQVRTCLNHEGQAAARGKMRFTGRLR